MTNAPRETPADERPSGSYLDAKGAWLGSLDHKRIALLQLVSLAAVLVLGAGYAVVLGLERARGGVAPLDEATYRRALAAHGLVMVFLVVVPAIPAVLGQFALPLVLGAKNLAFPRMARAGLWLYWLGAALVVGGALTSSPRAGFTFTEAYDPSITTGSVIVAMAGTLVVATAGLLTGLNAIVTIHKLRARGLAFSRLPLFAWSSYASALIAIVAPAPFALLFVLTIAERTLQVGVFDAALGGDPLLFQRLFWFYAHPAIFSAVLSGLGVAGELVAAHARRRPFGRTLVAALFLGLALLSFTQWGIHLVSTGRSGLASLSSLFVLLAAVPMVLLLANLVATLRGGSVALDGPMLFALATIANLTVWVATSLALGRLDLATYLRGTSFEIAHQHYGLAGGALTAFLGGLLHWWPKVTGRIVDDRLARLAAVLVFLGANVAFLAQLASALAGAGRARADLAGALSVLHAVGAGGALVLAGAVVLTLLAMLWSLREGARASADPWGAEGLEWRTSSPPPVENFAARAAVGG